MDGLVNDLLSIIAVYATTPVTLTLLTLSPYSTTGLYNLSLIKNKVTVETKGLHLDDRVLRAHTGSSLNVWWRYYLAINNTFYGRLLGGTWNYSVGELETTISEDTPVTACSSIAVSNPGSDYLYVVSLTDNGEIILRKYYEHGSGTAPIPSAEKNLVVRLGIGKRGRFLPYKGSNGRLYYLSERGEVYRIIIDYTERGAKLRYLSTPLISGDGLISVGAMSTGYSSDGIFAFYRDGSHSVYDREGEEVLAKIPNPTMKIIQFHSPYDGGAKVLTPTGEYQRIVLDRDTFELFVLGNGYGYDPKYWYNIVVDGGDNPGDKIDGTASIFYPKPISIDNIATRTNQIEYQGHFGFSGFLLYADRMIRYITRTKDDNTTIKNHVLSIGQHAATGQYVSQWGWNKALLTIVDVFVSENAADESVDGFV